MQKLCFLLLFVIGFNFALISSTYAETAPYQLAIINPAQIVHEKDSIKGIRFNLILGVNNNVHGIDMGFINQVDGNQRGLQFGIINNSFKTTGVQIGIINKTEYLEGIQIGFLNIHNEGDLRFMPGINFKF